MSTSVPHVACADVPSPLPDQLLVVDVREQDEWAAGHIAEAVHIPLMQVPQRVDDIPSDRPVLVVCRVGARSAQAAGFLQAQGRDVVNLTGGMLAWEASGRPMVADSGGDPVVA